jgi:hypothetical protein
LLDSVQGASNPAPVPGRARDSGARSPDRRPTSPFAVRGAVPASARGARACMCASPQWEKFRSETAGATVVASGAFFRRVATPLGYGRE